MHPLRIVGCAAALLLACSPNKNSIDEGDPIPGTDIVSCGDDFIDDRAPPAGLVDPSVDASGSKTILAGSVIWQASCRGPAGATQFALERFTIYRDDAGFPGDELGRGAFALRGAVECREGATKSQKFAPLEVFSLRDLCAERAAKPTGAPLFVHVEVAGKSTTCSATEAPLLLRSKVGLTCPKP